MGVIPAILYQRYEKSVDKEEFFSDQWSQTGEGVVGPMISTVRAPFFDFGNIDPTQHYSREFIVENLGDSTLEIWSAAQPTDFVKCDLGSKKISVAAGSSYPIKVSFSGKDVESELNATVRIMSNDARYSKNGFKIKLTGRVNK